MRPIETGVECIDGVAANGLDPNGAKSRRIGQYPAKVA
jgi:hypothetical protein